MILVADSGSTKTDWACINEAGYVKYYESDGFNPYYKTGEDLKHLLDKDLLPVIDNEYAVKEVYFYGSGCSTPKKQMVVEEAINWAFPNARVDADHDLLGAARALLGRNEGIACILGTGSNSCYYDGRKIVENVPSIGYLFGDEGSGTYLGKLFITAYLQNKFPEDLKEIFEKRHNVSLESILDAVYNQGRPNVFLASFSRFILQHVSHDFLRQLVLRSFDDFFREQVSKYAKYKDVEIQFTGSIAHAYEAFLLEVAAKYGVTVGKIHQKPIEGLVAFHKM
jgi:N-acetylglucosamine kinase-like BadF-type ATPase